MYDVSNGRVEITLRYHPGIILMNRYEYHKKLTQFGQRSESILSQARVAIIGIGALGSMTAQILARSGIGSITLFDPDRVELHNLHRQFLFTEEDVKLRRYKATAAEEHLRAGNSAVELIAFTESLTPQNALKVLADIDVIIDGTDNFETRFLINEIAVFREIPWIHGGVLAHDGLSMFIYPGKTACYSCYLPHCPERKNVSTTADVGVLNTAVIMVASTQATLLYKYLLEPDRTIPSEIIHIDGWQGTMNHIPIVKLDDCPVCSKKKFAFLLQSP